MIETQSDIVVEKDGSWTFHGRLLDNEGVLSHFQQNLKRDNRGYFIENRFGARVEHGYLAAVRGFPLRVTKLARAAGPAGGWDVRLEHGGSVRVEATAFRFVDDVTIIVLLPSGVPARLSGVAMVELAAFLLKTEPPTLAGETATHVMKTATAEELIGVQTSSSDRVDPRSSSGMSTMESPT